MKEANDENVDRLPNNPDGEANPTPKQRHLGKIGRLDVTPARREFYDEALFQDPKFRERHESSQQEDQQDANAEVD